MKNIISLLPIFMVGLTGATVTSDGIITIPSSYYSELGQVLLNLGLSIINMVMNASLIWVVFAVLLGVGAYILSKLSHK